MITPAIFYHPDGYTTEGARLMGRRVAGRDFLRAHFEAMTRGGVERVTCHAATRELAAHFAREGRRYAYGGRTRLVALDQVEHLAEDGVLYLPDPSLGRHAAHRMKAGASAYSLMGVIHTLASAATLDLIAGLATDPIAPWDALVCTSNAGRAVVSALLDATEAHLAERVGATRFLRPQLPVIPLGVHVDDFAGLRADKAEARAALGLPRDARVLVYVGRLSLHAKAHPLPLYQAIARASEVVGPIVLIEVGSFGDASTGEAFAEMRARFPGLLGGIVGGAEAASEEEKLACLAAADAFVSLADNVQETFGISVIEAMAAGLPVIVSDWDGYKDTVRDGVEGLRVRTALPMVGAAAGLIASYDHGLLDYDRYVGYLSQHCAIDVDHAARAIATVLGDPERAHAMGEAGTRRAAEYRWDAIYDRYQALWAELAALRAAHVEAQGRAVATAMRPLRAERPHPESLYASFPTATTSGSTRWRLDARGDPSHLDLQGVAVPLAGVAERERLRAHLDALAQAPRTTAELAPSGSPEVLARTSGELHALWKYGLVTLDPAE